MKKLGVGYLTRKLGLTLKPVRLFLDINDLIKYTFIKLFDIYNFFFKVRRY